MRFKNNVTTTFDEKVLRQHISYDRKSKKIEVVHYFNLEKGEDVMLSRIEKSVLTVKGNEVALAKYKPPKQKIVERGEDVYVTRFIYHKFEANFKDPHARKFPDRGTSYPLSYLPHHIEVIVE